MIPAEGASRELVFTDFTALALLSFDGQKLYLSGYFPAAKAFGVVLFDTTAGEELARYETPDAVRTLAFSENHLVFGMHSGLTVASAACSSEGS